jgi:RHS repeat-associated protein
VSVADASGHPISINRYDEYGKPATSNAGRFQYTGQAWLPELGLYYYKARVYDPRLGRFLQTDPVGYQDDLDLYAYVGNDPLNATDPTGEWCVLGIGTSCLPTVPLPPTTTVTVTAAGAITATASEVTTTVVVEGTKDAAVLSGGALSALAAIPAMILRPSNGLFGHDFRDETIGRTNYTALNDADPLDDNPVATSCDGCSTDSMEIRKTDEDDPGHKSNIRPSTWNKHTKPRPGRSSDKKRHHSGWKPNPNKRKD